MKKELNTYDPIYALTEFDEWSYCVDNKMWYEDKREVLPHPIQNSEILDDFICDIKVNYDGVWGDTWETIEEEPDGFEEFAQYLLGENSGSDCVFSGVLFKSPNQEQTIIFNDDGFIELDKFINKLKKYNFATQYFEDAYFCKFIAWTDKENNTRFVIYSYRGDYRYLEILFDITVPKDVLIDNLEKVIEVWKQTVYKEITNYFKKTYKRISDIQQRTRAINYFFSELFNEAKK